MEQVLAGFLMLFPALAALLLIVGGVAMIGYAFFHHRHIYGANQDTVGGNVHVINRRSGKDRRLHSHGESGHLAA